MRFSEQFLRYRNEFGSEPPYPRGAVQCYWMRRRMGMVGERINIVLSPEACRHFGVWAPQALNKERAARISNWMAAQEDG